jgi:probable HAF family extracellular repeat protein
VKPWLAPIACILAVLPSSMIVQSAPRSAFVIEHVSVHGLGALGRGDGSAYDINDQGDAVGWSATPSGLKHAVLFRDGAVVDIGAWHPTWASEARQINEAGLVVGHSTFLRDGLAEWRPFAWIGGWMVDLDVTITGDDAGCQRRAEARAVNDDGVIVGTFWDGTEGGRPCFTGQPGIRWAGPAESPTWLASSARAIVPNDLLNDGTFVGDQTRDLTDVPTTYAFWSRLGTWLPVPLPPLAAGDRPRLSSARSINARRDIVGWHTFRRGTAEWTRAFMWPAGTERAYELDLLGSSHMRAEGINDDRFVVGSAAVVLGGVSRRVAYLYHPSLGMRILPILPPLTAENCSANALNERNPSTGMLQIVGSCGTARLRPVRWDVHVRLTPPPTTP